MRSNELRNWMWSEALDWLDQAERLHRRFFSLAEAARAPQGMAAPLAPAWEPPIDIIETPEALQVHVALPGVAPEDIAVGIDAGALVISALRPFPACERGARVHRLEIPYGRFERRIALPDRAPKIVETRYADGCLTLTLAANSESR